VFVLSVRFRRLSLCTGRRFIPLAALRLLLPRLLQGSAWEPLPYTHKTAPILCIYLRCFACRFLLSFGGCSGRARRLPHGATMTRTLRLPCSNRIHVHLFRCGIHAFGSELDWHAYEALCETTPHLRFPVPVRWLGRFFLYDRPPWPAAFIPHWCWRSGVSGPSCWLSHGFLRSHGRCCVPVVDLSHRL